MKLTEVATAIEELIARVEAIEVEQATIRKLRMVQLPPAPVPPWSGHKRTKNSWLCDFKEHGLRQDREYLVDYVLSLEDHIAVVGKMVSEIPALTSR